MDNINLSPDMMENLLKLAGKKLGKSPGELKSKIESGDASGLMSGLDPKLQSKISELANNPKAMEALMKNGSVGNLLSGLMKNKK